MKLVFELDLDFDDGNKYAVAARLANFADSLFADVFPLDLRDTNTDDQKFFLGELLNEGESKTKRTVIARVEVLDEAFDTKSRRVGEATYIKAFNDDHTQLKPCTKDNPDPRGNLQ